MILVLNDATVSHTEVHAFGGEPCRLLQLALHVVFITVFFQLMHAGLPYMGMPAPCTQRCACPLPCSAQTPLHSALCFRDYCQHFVQDGSSEVFFSGEQRTYFDFKSSVCISAKTNTLLPLPLSSLATALPDHIPSNQSSWLRRVHQHWYQEESHSYSHFITYRLNITQVD